MSLRTYDSFLWDPSIDTVPLLLLFSIAPFPGKWPLNFKFSGLGTGEEEEGSRDGQEDGGEAAGGHQVSKP